MVDPETLSNGYRTLVVQDFNFIPNTSSEVVGCWS
jgi:hypothetical protein